MKGSKSCSPAARPSPGKETKKLKKPFGPKRLAAIGGPAPLKRRKQI